MKKRLILLTCVNLWALSAWAQKPLQTIATKASYATLPNNKKLVLLRDSIPDLKLDLVYATTNNFTHTKLYDNPKVLTTPPMASALRKAADRLRKQDIGLLIFDAYRPYAVSKKMWQIVHDSRYVANPVYGSDHNRGTAIDLSLYNIKTGQALEMPTEFDNFSTKAHLSYQPSSAHILTNRNLLQKTMKEVGLRPLETEWWHFYLPNSRDFEVLDLDFDTF